jgi:hypothetical protein
MNIILIDKILAACERARARGTIPEAEITAVVADALGICESLVTEAERIGVTA